MLKLDVYKKNVWKLVMFKKIKVQAIILMIGLCNRQNGYKTLGNDKQKFRMNCKTIITNSYDRLF